MERKVEGATSISPYCLSCGQSHAGVPDLTCTGLWARNSARCGREHSPICRRNSRDLDEGSFIYLNRSDSLRPPRREDEGMCRTAGLAFFFDFANERVT
jgi:hypothetical protein